MEKKTKVEIISRKAISPSTPTSPQCRNLELSLLDQVMPPVYTSIVLFFSSNTSQSTDSSFRVRSEKSCQLKSSLPKTLVHFYPFAGRLNGNTSIECSDEGAYFLEAEINCQLSDFLKEPDSNLLGQLLPSSDPEVTELARNVVLLVQLTVFNCGGIAVSVCATHKVADASSLCEFVKSWAAMTREEDEVVPPEFIGASILPPHTTGLPIERCLKPPGESFITKRFVFDVSKLTNLKAKIGSGVQQLIPTNVELISAIFLRCAISACQSTTGCFKPSILYQTVNLRTRMAPPVPESAIGNLLWGFPVVVEEECKTDVGNIVAKMRKGLTNFCNEKANRFKGEDGHSLVFESFKAEGEALKMGIMYSCSSWCKFPFYEVDFGWGKPTWITNPMYAMNSIALMDAKRGEGIEAWVTLEKQVMAMFESNEELLAFASINPRVIF